MKKRAKALFFDSSLIFNKKYKILYFYKLKNYTRGIIVVNGLVIKLEKVDYGNSEYWLVFKDYIPQHDINKLYDFEFYGTELETNAYLTAEQVEQLREIFSKRFGYAPFKDLKKLKIN